MAYFSNSSDGGILDDLCFSCIHGCDEHGENRQGSPCAVWLLQSEWNYKQFETDPMAGNEMCVVTIGNVTTHRPFGLETDRAKAMKHALNVLVPNTTEQTCAMYLSIEEETYG